MLNVRLRAATGYPLAEERVRETVIATANAIAERTGVGIDSVNADGDSVLISIDADEIVAIGFLAELRRLTNNWYQAKFGESLWGEPPENGSADADSMRRWLDEMQAQQQQLLAAQQAAQGQAEQLAGAAGELTSAREAWTVAQQQIQEHREQLDDIRAAFSSSQINSGGDDDQLKQQVDELRQQHVELQQQHGQLEQERTLLESELETVRNRAAEMTESLADQKRSLALQQTQWADELKHMRRLMEGMSRRLAEPPPPQPDRPAEPQLAAVAAGPPAEASSGDDPVLDSVMAQFQMLQQDLARRRTQQ